MMRPRARGKTSAAILRDILITHEETPQTQWIVDRIRREFPLLAAAVDCREEREAKPEK